MKNKKSLIIIAHGSKLNSSNNEVKNLVKNLQRKSDLNIKYAFLELTEPSLESVFKECIKEGESNIKVFPYFLARGKHVKTDIPNLIKEFKNSNPDIEISITTHFGKLNGIEELILKNIN